MYLEKIVKMRASHPRGQILIYLVNKEPSSFNNVWLEVSYLWKSTENCPIVHGGNLGHPEKSVLWRTTWNYCYITPDLSETSTLPMGCERLPLIVMMNPEKLLITDAGWFLTNFLIRVY